MNMRRTEDRPPLPAGFSERIRLQFGDEATDLLAALEGNAVAAIQAHPFKPFSSPASGNSVPWYPSGHILNERPSFILDPYYHSGCYYPQEASSMVIGWITEWLFGDRRSILILDYCASPGGKSLLLLNHLRGSGMLVSNEVVPKRNTILRQNLIRWGIPGYITTASETSAFAQCGLFFDLVLVDAPCSGEGMFRKDPASRREWNASSNRSCAIRQRAILSDMHKLQHDGAYLIYSTCTLANEENIEQCVQLVETGQYVSVALPLPESFNASVVVRNGVTGYQFLPHRALGEGFFFCVLKKRGDESSVPKTRLRAEPRWREYQPDGAEPISLDIPDRLFPVVDDAGVVTLSPIEADELNGFAGILRISSTGQELFQTSGGRTTPLHGLAMLSTIQFEPEQISLNREAALSYLRGESISGDFCTSGKFVAVCHGDARLGWAKQVPGRLNNHYPPELRIKKR